jgi:ATP-dependent exoDNAse (exonuclease V) alpha subunit
MMKPELTPGSQEVLAGLVERITFHNEEIGFCVLRSRARGRRDLVTVVGQAAAISAGEWITASGEWINDRTHGQQFRARFLKTSAPTSIEGIEKYLGSRIIRGIGPPTPRFVRSFGEKVFDTIEAEPDRLREVTGIGPRAGEVNYRRLGRTEGRVRDHDVSALERGRNGSRRADLQDLRFGRRSGDDREPLPANPGRTRHRLQDRRRDRDETRDPEDGDDSFAGRPLDLSMR